MEVGHRREAHQRHGRLRQSAALCQYHDHDLKIAIVMGKVEVVLLYPLVLPSRRAHRWSLGARMM